MSRQLTIQGLSDQMVAELEELSRQRRQSIDTTVLEILQGALISSRRERLERYATWSPEDLREFESTLAAQRS